MLSPTATIFEFFLVPLAVVIIYHDVRYRRIPNPFVLATLISGLTINFAIGGLPGALNSIGGCVLARSEERRVGKACRLRRSMMSCIYSWLGLPLTVLNA